MDCISEGENLCSRSDKTGFIDKSTFSLCAMTYIILFEFKAILLLQNSNIQVIFILLGLEKLQVRKINLKTLKIRIFDFLMKILPGKKMKFDAQYSHLY